MLYLALLLGQMCLQNILLYSMKTKSPMEPWGGGSGCLSPPPLFQPVLSAPPDEGLRRTMTMCASEKKKLSKLFSQMCGRALLFTRDPIHNEKQTDFPLRSCPQQ